MNLKQLLAPYAPPNNEEERIALKLVAKSGDADALLRQAVCQALGYGVHLNKAATSRTIKTLAEQGNAQAAYLLGLRRFTNSLNTTDWNKNKKLGFKKESANWLEKARGKGLKKAGVALAILNGGQHPSDKRMLKAAAKNDPDAAYFLAKQALAENNIDSATKLLRHAIDLGADEAAVLLGSIYFSGTHGLLTPNPREALALWKPYESFNGHAAILMGLHVQQSALGAALAIARKAAGDQQIDASSTAAILDAILADTSIQTRLRKAKSLFAFAVSSFAQDCSYFDWWIYDDGWAAITRCFRHGLPLANKPLANWQSARNLAHQSLTEVRAWLGEPDASAEYGKSLAATMDPRSFAFIKAAVEKGQKEARFALGECLYRGTGCEINYEGAQELFRTLATEGDPAAMFYVGWNLVHGVGVSKNIDEARWWYAKSEKLGELRSLEALYELDKLGQPAAARRWLERIIFRLHEITDHDSRTAYAIAWLQVLAEESPQKALSFSLPCWEARLPELLNNLPINNQGAVKDSTVKILRQIAPVENIDYWRGNPDTSTRFLLESLIVLCRSKDCFFQLFLLFAVAKAAFTKALDERPSILNVVHALTYDFQKCTFGRSEDNRLEYWLESLFKNLLDTDFADTKANLSEYQDLLDAVASTLPSPIAEVSDAQGQWANSWDTGLLLAIACFTDPAVKLDRREAARWIECSAPHHFLSGCYLAHLWLSEQLRPKRHEDIRTLLEKLNSQDISENFAEVGPETKEVLWRMKGWVTAQLSEIRVIDERARTTEEILSYLTHTLKNRLASGPQQAREVMRILGSGLFDGRPRDYTAILNVGKMYSTFLFTQHLASTFKLYISEPDRLRQNWLADAAGDASVPSVIAAALSETLSQLVFLSDYQSALEDLSPEGSTDIKRIRKSFTDEIVPLEHSMSTEPTLYAWVGKYLPNVIVEVDNSMPWRFSTNGTRYLFLFSCFAELMSNAFKYVGKHGLISITWQRQNDDWRFAIENRCAPEANSSGRLPGAGKGLTFVHRAAEVLGARLLTDFTREVARAELVMPRSLWESAP